MKFLVLTQLSMIAVFGCASGDKKLTTFSSESDTLDARYVRLVPDTNNLMMIERVSISFGDMKLKADSAFYQKKLQTITCYSVSMATFKGAKITGIKPTSILRYKKGEDGYTIR